MLTRLGITAAALLILGACTSDPNEADPPATSADLARYYHQDVTFGPCDAYATTSIDEQVFALDKTLPDTTFECGRLEVPIDYAEPDGKTTKLAVLRARARGTSIGSLVVNPGGPGGPGLQLAALTAATWKDTAITGRFDLVGFDPRGIGASKPAVNCYTDAEADAGEVRFTLRGSEGTWTRRDTRGLADRCTEGSGEDILAHVGTVDTARDMDVLRAAVGDKKLSFVGQSYGTRLGTVYATMFPHKVRAMVLDGAVDPTQDSAERQLSQFAGFQRSFEQMAAACAAGDGCPLGNDPKRATEAFQDIVRPLIDEPVPAGEGRRLQFNDATGAVTAGLYSKKQWPDLIAGIAELKTGRGDKLRTIGDAFSGRGDDGRWSNFGEANFAIRCMDEQRTTPQEEVDLRQKLFDAAPFQDPGTGADDARDGCEFWPTEPTLEYPYADDVNPDLAKTLTISITGDPATPFKAGERLAAALGGSMLTVKGEQHTVALSGTNQCVNDVVADYLVNLKVPDEKTSCTIE